ncbi:PREDICTED: uncharacterized protein LOC107173177 [Diuraphis noxia]|uniref:uncharacterized protein LOC107173177 n=1 Tax=Diuraphis noxia TaxID=143948 RepID=UPI0007637754|nr:PREDICTED: uncharacterized protein LOC107173177 [Diuraphis noxia]
MLEKKLYGCGTFRKNRKFYPKDILQSDKSIKKGDFDFVQSGDITVTKWKDRGKNPVIVVSNMHDGSKKINVLRTNSIGSRDSVPCTASISDYNMYMGGVDKKRKSYTRSVELGVKKTTNNSTFQDVGKHVPIQGKYRRCGFCSTKEKEKRSNLICKACDKALCKSCFGPYHDLQ